MNRAVVCWSSGKDSAFALHAARQQGALEVVAILTTLNGDAERVSMHGVRETLLDAQARMLALPCLKVPLPAECANDVYEREMGRACERLLADGVTHMIFGDLFLADIRAYRERMLADTGITPVFPLWGRDTAALAAEMVASGVRAHLSCIDTRQLDRGFAGRAFDESLLAELPTDVDPCGENGEFHTFCHAAPVFAREIPVRTGETHEADGFLFTDLVPAGDAAPD
jgi:uncharacterized protein (TIGR00290 family)